MRVYVGQVGCRLNYSEMETLARRLQAEGHLLVANPEQANVVVFNTCAVTSDASRGSRKEARRLHAVAPDARIVLTGCWATLAVHEAAELPGVAFVAPNNQKDLLPLLLEPWSADFAGPALLEHQHPDAPPSFVACPTPDNSAPYRSRTRAFVKVQDGCHNRCTFCIVTVARGESRSRPLAEVVEEVLAHAAVGVQEVVLTGVHLGGYGREGGAHSARLADLIEAILSESDIARVRLSSLEPWEIAPDFLALWSRWPGRLCPHLHLPLQSGNDAQLRAMARRCTTASFESLVAEARAAIPGLTVTTDLIAGFPGESDADFKRGLDFVREMRFLDAHIFPFSKRPGTAAARFADEPAGDVKRERARRLQRVVEQTGSAERGRFADTTRPVLWEGTGRPHADRSDVLRWSGMTDNGLRVEALAPTWLDLHGRVLSARLGHANGMVVTCVLEDTSSRASSDREGSFSGAPPSGVL